MAARIDNRSRGAGDGLRLPPHSIEAEQSVLGGLMLDATSWDQVADRVAGDDFYRRDHKLIFEAVAGLIERSQPCDAVTLSGHLESQGMLDQVGGLSYLGSLARDTPTAANIRAYADIVRERAVLRQLISAGNSIVGNALEPEGREAREIIDDAERAVFAIAERGSRGKIGFKSVKEILPEVVKPYRRAIPLGRRDHRHLHRIQGSRRNDVGSATRRSHHHRGAPFDGQDDAGGEHR